MKNLKNDQEYLNLKISLPKNIIKITPDVSIKKDMPDTPIFGPFEINPEIISRMDLKPHPPMKINRDATVFIEKILESTATEIYKKAYKVAAENGKNTIEIGDIESSIELVK